MSDASKIAGDILAKLRALITEGEAKIGSSEPQFAQALQHMRAARTAFEMHRDLKPDGKTHTDPGISNAAQGTSKPAPAATPVDTGPTDPAAPAAPVGTSKAS